MSFELRFLCEKMEKFFIAKLDKIATRNQVAEERNWEFSTLLDSSVSHLVHNKKRMLMELRDYLQAPPKSVIKHSIEGMQKNKQKTAAFAHARASASDAKSSCAVLAMESLIQ